jgi:phage tail protein X
VPLYAEATIRPEGSQADAISSLVERVAGSTTPLDQLPSKLDELMADAGLALTYEDDIAPWIGRRAAIFVRSFEPATPSGIPDLAVEIEADDVDAAKEFLDDAIGPAIAQEQSYSGVEYFSVRSENLDVGVVSDAVVFGTDAAFKLAVDTSHGESLADSEDYADRVSSLPDDPLATVFADPGAVIEAIAAANPGLAQDLNMLKPLLAGPLSSPIAATLTVTDESAAIDVAATVDGADGITEESPTLADLPADAWFAAALPGLGPVLSRTLDGLQMSGVPGADQLEAQLRRATGLDLNDDILSWLQGVAGFVSGTSERDLRAAVIANSDDPEAPRDLVDALRRLAEEELGSRAGPPPEGADYGFTVERSTLSLGEVGDRLIGGFQTSIDEALHPATTLADDDDYSAAEAALGDDFTPLAYAHLPGLLAVAEKGGAGDDPDFRAAQPYLDALGYLIAGARIDDGLVIARLVVGLQ